MNVLRNFPDLKTDRLILRNIGKEDIEFIYQLFSNEKVCEFLYDEELFTTKMMRQHSLIRIQSLKEKIQPVGIGHKR